MVGWHYRLYGYEVGQAPGVGDGQGGLACCSPWGRKESDTTEQLNRNELNPKTIKEMWRSPPTEKKKTKSNTKKTSFRGFLQERKKKFLEADQFNSIETILYNRKRTLTTYPITFITGSLKTVCHSLSCVRLFAIPWTVALQAPLSMKFSRQEYWSGLLCPPPRYLPKAGIEPVSLMSPALAGRFFTTSASWKPQNHVRKENLNQPQL